MKFRLLLSVVALMMAHRASAADVLPADRRTGWTPSTHVGIVGGIPTRTTLIDVTQTPYNADNTGATDATTAIQNAINAAASGEVVYLPAGTYRLDGGLSLGHTRDNITLRGAGQGVTVLMAYGGGPAIYVGSNSNYDWNYPNQAITGSPQKGDTVLSMADTSNFSEGQLIRIARDNSADPEVPTFDAQGYRYKRIQMSRVVSKTASSVTIEAPGLYFDCPSSLAPEMDAASQQTTRSGIESLTVDLTNATGNQNGVYFEQTAECWVYDVKITNAGNRNLVVTTGNYRPEVRQSRLEAVTNEGSNGACLLYEATSAGLIEDNILLKAFPLIEVNSGASGNVFAYNYLDRSDVGAGGGIGIGIDTNHGSHNSFNLYEGNISPNTNSDGYWGGESEVTHFRSWFTGVSNRPVGDGGAIEGWSHSFNRGTRNGSLIKSRFGTTGVVDGGFSFGNPNMGNGNSTGAMSAQSQSGTISSGTITGQTGHGITTGATLAWVAWVATVNEYPIARVRRNVTVGTVSGNSIPVSGGSGDTLPTSGTVYFPTTNDALRVWWSTGLFYRETGAYDSGATYYHGPTRRSIVTHSGTTYLANNTGKNGTATWGTPGVADWVEYSLTGFETRWQEMDLDVAIGVIAKDNYLVGTGDQGLDEGETYPDSYFRSTKPAYFGSLTWPFDPDGEDYEAIPAGYRYYNDETPPGETAPTAPNTATLAQNRNIGGTISWTDASSNETGFEVDRSFDNSNWTQIATTAANATSYRDETAPAGATVYYRVRAVNGAGDSANATPTPSSITTGAPAPVRRSKNGGAVRTGGGL